MSQLNILRYETEPNVFNFGLVTPESQTDENKQAVAAIGSSIPQFENLMLTPAALPEKVVLNVLQAEAIKKFEKYIPPDWLFETAIDGKPCKLFKNIQQNSGSCVGTRHTRYALDHTLYEAFWLNEPERIVFPYTMYHYANGRSLGGLRSRGEGSFGTSQAKALVELGVIPFDFGNGLPPVKIGQEIEWTGSEEIKYSIPSSFPQEAAAEGKKHRFGEAVRVNAIESAKTILASGRSLVFCSDIGFGMEAPLKEGIRYFSRRSSTWHHCWGIDGYWVHPVLGLIFRLSNNWGSAHGKDPSTGDDFGFWVPQSVVEYIMQSNETFAFIDFLGFKDDLRRSSQLFDLVY